MIENGVESSDKGGAETKEGERKEGGEERTLGEKEDEITGEHGKNRVGREIKTEMRRKRNKSTLKTPAKKIKK
jgi:hypothetical protein